MKRRLHSRGLWHFMGAFQHVFWHPVLWQPVDLRRISFDMFKQLAHLLSMPHHLAKVLAVDNEHLRLGYVLD